MLELKDINLNNVNQLTACVICKNIDNTEELVKLCQRLKLMPETIQHDCDGQAAPLALRFIMLSMG